jgi:hypothetical protein
MTVEDKYAGQRSVFTRGQVATLTQERDAARANARELAHAYTHDSLPRPKVVAEALAYPAIPAAAYTQFAVIVKFDRDTLRGLLMIDGEVTGRPFHGTSCDRWPDAAERVEIALTDKGDVLAVHHIDSGPNAAASPRARASTARKPKTKGVRARGAGVRR